MFTDQLLSAALGRRSRARVGARGAGRGGRPGGVALRRTGISGMTRPPLPEAGAAALPAVA